MDNRKDIFLDHMTHFITFDDGTSPPPPGFAKIAPMLIVILETHLFVEARLIMLVEQSIPHPEEIRGRFGFDQKVRLAAALGIVSPEEKNVLLKLNQWRNKLAHNLNWTPTQQEVMALYDVLTTEQKSIAPELPASTDLNRLIVHVMCLLSAHFTSKSVTAS